MPSRSSSDKAHGYIDNVAEICGEEYVTRDEVIKEAVQKVGEEVACAICDCGCFSEDAPVNVTGKGMVQMKDLQVGDEVEAMTSAGLLTHSTIQFFLHRDPEQIAEFRCFCTDDGRELLLTAEHQLGVVDDDDGVLFTFAADVLEGMQLVVPTEDRSQLVRIVSIQRRTFAGIYAPCTGEGTIVVAGLGCSCYALVQHEDAHKSLAVLRRPLAQFPTAANQACHGVVRCLRVPVFRKVALRSRRTYQPTS